MEMIKDSGIYLRRMRRTFADKMWFMSVLPDGVEHIVDFGCADNSFLREMDRMYPGYHCVGIDNNPEFLEMAKKNGDEVYGSLEACLPSVDPSKSVLVMNSVLHEIYSYADPAEFWRQASGMGFKYVAVRDMYAKGCGCFTSRTASELAEACRKDSGICKKYADYCGAWNLREIDNGYDAVHFLLKYFYDENWDRELRENYLPYDYREFHRMTRKMGYDVEFEQFYGLPYLKGKWKADFPGRPVLHSFFDQVTTHFKAFMSLGPEMAIKSEAGE